MKRWEGQTVVCIASGPSLTDADCEAVRKSGLPVIVTNNTWQMVPWADVMYAGDYQWWKRYHAELNTKAELWTCNERASREFGLKHHQTAGEYNTGARALQFARDMGASRILMLGYDMGFGADGAVHWHGRHETGADADGKRILVGNPDANRFKVWIKLFQRLAGELRAVDVINCSRATALDCFKRARLEDVLC